MCCHLRSYYQFRLTEIIDINQHQTSLNNFNRIIKTLWQSRGKSEHQGIHQVLPWPIRCASLAQNRWGLITDVCGVPHIVGNIYIIKYLNFTLCRTAYFKWDFPGSHASLNHRSWVSFPWYHPLAKDTLLTAFCRDSIFLLASIFMLFTWKCNWQKD